MIGLRRHTVRVVEYEPEWASLFELEAAALRERIGEIVTDIQHIGSTAVPGMSAKPILDIAVAVPSRHAIGMVAGRLSGAGYIDRGNAGSGGGHLVVRESEPDVRSVHIHIVELSDDQWWRYITFRDMLRQDEGLRQRYAELKRSLAELHANDRKSYTAAKEEFISEVLNRPNQNAAADTRRRPPQQ